ncbi:glycosyltransferase family 2 protein [Methylobacterium sp. NMS14P]|uniref:glycosyltransferase family 2 protein n=1 Tax=Methylobacterium sp. NMS14P TaxID=2894310 RepID=UPI0023581856|nr:glycosyltransferase family 2 protein [Methylobacterium sp. NMS14P]WCS24353.1 glycosyltransferase family 2 protein [Methylobacterium sp. NMS14P]
MITEPKLAVVITCFNYENFVGRAIQSVIDQGSDACEIVVIDDGSTDRSWSIIQQSGVPAFRLPNGGQRAACLYGLSRTRAPFLLFLDADDELRPGALARILPALDSDVAKLQFCLTCIDLAGTVLADPYPALDAFRGQDRIVNDILRSGVYQTPPTSGNVFRRDVCELLHQCEYDQAVDGVILLAAPFMGDIVSLPDSLGLYRVHGRNDSGLGRVPQAATFERDLRRFQSRLAHLRDLLRNWRPGASLIEPRKTYYFQFLEFCTAILRGTRYGGRAFLRLIGSVLTEPRPLKWKVANALFVVAMFLAPVRCARALLAFRFSLRRRPVRQILRASLGAGHC